MSASEFHESLKKKLAEIGIGLDYTPSTEEGGVEVYIPLGRKGTHKE